MKNIVKIIFLLFVLFAYGCKEEVDPKVEDIETSIDLLDSNLNPKSVFNYGEDIVFEYKEWNNSVFNYKYYRSNCPLKQFNIYNASDSLIGGIFVNRACHLALIQLSIDSGEENIFTASWIKDGVREPLPKGDYSIIYKDQIDLVDPNQRRDVNETIEFQIK